MKVKLSDIIEAIEMTSQDSEYFLDKETGDTEDRDRTTGAQEICY